jgi:hypothetical protein
LSGARPRTDCISRKRLARRKEAARIVARGQGHAPRLHTRLPQLHAQPLRGPRAAAIRIGVETDVDRGPLHPAKLGELQVVEMRAEGRPRVVEAGLPQSRQIGEAFHQNDAATTPGWLPAVKPAFGARQKTMATRALGQRATVQVAGFRQRKSETAEERVAAPEVDQAARAQRLAAVTEPLQITAQTGARGIADAHALEDSGVSDSACGQIRTRVWAMRELPLVEAIEVCSNNSSGGA